MSVAVKWKNHRLDVPILDATGAPAFHSTTLGRGGGSGGGGEGQWGDDLWRSLGDQFQSVGRSVNRAFDEFASWLGEDGTPSGAYG
ncbi:hypothetical protein HK405_002938 [Cladochytrium tenue]|nr:hypothetical protein HK405_002938 [Cladochytrium tenue]